ncbi:UvrD-helicase domain-containing protein [Candidatus Gracilibacteria bacterium]|nr:UvrD-helicase domain-containing protein [Candidatus Gracilibacteria bacterium]
MKANTQQQQAIEYIKGPLLIIAGAGSGKTATLTQRIAYMISKQNILAPNVLALTFTNKAAAEMKQRTGKAIGAEYHPHMMRNRHLPYIGTFHSFGIFVLKEVLAGGYEKIEEAIGLKKDFLIYDEADKLSVMKSIIKDEMGLIEKEYPPRQVAYFISDAKNKSLDSKSYQTQVDSNLKEVVAKAFEKYEIRLRENNAIDFDDILGKLLSLFEIPEILEYYQEKYQYVMVDEYQDTNIVQYKIVSLLAGKYRNLAVVGDDWQSIYSWRGADMRNIIEFKKDYPDAKIIKLEQNYRSTKCIIKAANSVIQNNKEALKKELWTDNQEGEKIHYVITYDDKGEANFIAENIEEDIQEKKGSYSDNLILYRTNAQSRSIEEGLIKKNIPYKILGGLKFYDRKEVKDMLGYLRVILNQNDPVGFKRIINTPARKIGAKSLQVLDSYRDNFGVSYFQIIENIEEVEDLRPQARESLYNFGKMFEGFFAASNELSPSLLLQKIIDDTRYEDYLREQFSEDEFVAKKENLQELRNVASEYDGLAPREALSLFLEEVALISDVQKTEEGEVPDTNFVTLMTIHSAKGLEQKRVFVTGLEEGMFPHSRTLMKPAELEEERRLMYVAMTRAREELFITRAKERLYFGDYVKNPESRFMKEIPEECLETEEIGSSFSFSSMSSFSQDTSEPMMRVARKPAQENNVADFRAGEQVEHHKFGIGVIDSLIGELAEIRFRSGIKKMNIRIAPVKKVN